MKYVSNGNPNMIIWNPETKKILCQFQDGKFETNDKKAIVILDNVAATENRNMLGEIKPPRISRDDGTKTKTTQLDHAPTAPEDMSIKQLIAYAKENEIDIPKKAKGKTAVLAVIEEALTSD